MRRFLSLFTLLILSTVLAFAQNRVVTGTITDQKGLAIEGASIKVKGSKAGTIADLNGNFKISVPEGSTLIISGVGITAQEFAVGNQSNLSLNVTRSSTELAAVVVTAAGIRRSEKTLGYAISKVDPNALLQKSEPDVLKGLQGKVAGVDIRSGQGTPGAATRIQIRGNSSFYGNNQPLIIVDGVPFSNDQVSTSGTLTGGGAYGSGIADLDPNDIASMNILKGSSAGALYGSRASNGVIIITTKSGTVARTRKGTEVTFKSSLSFETIANLPDYQNSFGTGSQGVAGGGSNGSWGKQFAPGDSVAAWAQYNTAYPELFPNGKVAYKAFPNNVKDLFTTGVVTENSVGFNTGDEKTSFSLTGSQLFHSGYVPNNKYNRTNISAGGSSKLDIGLNVRGNFSYTRSQQQGGLFGENQDNSGPSSQFARTMFLGRSWDVSLPFEDKLGRNVSWVGTQADNPLWAAKYNKQNTYDERIVAGVHLDFNINKWARLDYNVGSNVSYVNRREINEVSSRGGLGKLALDNYRNQELESTLLLSLTPTIGKDFTLKSTLGTNFNQRTSARELGTGGYRPGGGGYIVRGLYTLQNFLSVDRTISDTYSRRRLLGVFGDLTVGYKNFAFVSVTGRNDISSTLPANNRSYFYPSISGSFVFSDAFKMNSGVLDFGKIRAGYAKVGRDADPYNIFNIYGLSSTSFLGQAVGNVSSDANGGDALQPEFTKELEIGTQLSFLKRKVEVDFTWYDKRSTNMLAPITTPSSTGYTSFYTNFGGISNKGVEIELTIRPIMAKNFNWEIRGVFTKNTNIVTSLAEGITHLNLGGGFSDITTGFEVGKPYGFLFGTQSLRDSATGQLLINKLDGTMIEDPTNRMIGNPNPDYKLGITNTFRYKGFVLSALFDMTKGGDLYSVTNSSMLGRGVTMDTEDRLTGWVIPGIYADAVTGKAILNGGKTIPNQTRITTNDLYFSPGTGNTFAINTSNEWNIYDATVYRLRELSLGYELPKSIFKKSRISSVTFTLTGRNLWYLAPNFPKHSNFDPETSSYGTSPIQGLEFSAAPTTRRFGLNLNATF
ncbi:MAG: outer membrane protein nutrient binding [Ferruginibacter sp.]|nr:outer membrane protein nutrient binding [Ferruginibacter sp.]